MLSAVGVWGPFGKAGIFAGSLELVKEGNLSIKQDNLFDDIYVREIND